MNKKGRPNKQIGVTEDELLFLLNNHSINWVSKAYQCSHLTLRKKIKELVIVCVQVWKKENSMVL